VQEGPFNPTANDVLCCFFLDKSQQQKTAKILRFLTDVTLHSIRIFICQKKMRQARQRRTSAAAESNQNS